MTTESMLLSRRALVRGGAALAASGLALSRPAIVRAQAVEKELVFACDGGSTQSIFERVVLPPFEKQTGTRITYVPQQPADTVAKLRAQRGHSGVDVAWLAGAVTYVAVDEGLLQAFDLSRVPNAANINAKIPREAEILPVSTSGNALLYNKQIFNSKKWAAPTSWFDLWDSRFAGHTGMYSMASTGGVEMLLEVAKEMTGDYNNVDAAFPKFAQLRKTIYDFFSTAGAWETAMQQGDLWLAVNSYTRALQLTQAGQPIGTVLPASGVPSHELHMGLVKGAAHPDAAHAFANYLLSPDVQELIVTNIGYAPTVNGVVIPDNLKAFFPAPEIAWFPDWRKIGARFEYIVAQWERQVER